MRKICLILLIFLMTACAPAATAFPEEAAATEPPALIDPYAPTQVVIVPEALASPTLPAPTSTEVPSTSAAVPMPGPTQTETALPTLELPSPAANPPALIAWDGQPTYPGDSQVGQFFRVMYNPELWAFTTDNFGSPALAHRTIPDCIVVPSVGRGLPSNVTVDHDFRKVGTVEYEINTAYVGGAPQFITYIGGDLNIYTGFEVSFKDQADACIADAETVLGTLASVPLSEATPIP